MSISVVGIKITFLKVNMKNPEKSGWYLAKCQNSGDECIRQAELATGLKVDRTTFSIIKREIRRWIVHKETTENEYQTYQN